jgi:RNA polymerase sigma factor (sigma-70 family)
MRDTDALAISRSLSEGGRASQSFELVFDRHHATIYRYLRRRVGAELAQELAAETFLQAFRARRRFAAGGDSALPWLYGIAANLVRMNRRAEERRLRAYARAAGERDDQPLSGGEVEARLDAAALAPALAAALTALSPVSREVLLLHAWGELSHEEIGEALDLSPAAVRTRLHRARAQVGEMLGEREESVTERRAHG